MGMKWHTLDEQAQGLPVNSQGDPGGHKRVTPQRAIEVCRCHGPGGQAEAGVKDFPALFRIGQVQHQPLVRGAAAPQVAHVHGVEGRYVQLLVEFGPQPLALLRAGQDVAVTLVPGGVVDLRHQKLQPGFVCAEAVVAGDRVHIEAEIAQVGQQVDGTFVVDAGLGAPSDAALAMEIGADAVLVNTAISIAGDPVKMAAAFAKAVEAGRAAYESGLGKKSPEASASSPLTGLDFIKS